MITKGDKVRFTDGENQSWPGWMNRTGIVAQTPWPNDVAVEVHTDGDPENWWVARIDHLELVED